jgi:hypothetical protein
LRKFLGAYSTQEFVENQTLKEVRCNLTDLAFHQTLMGLHFSSLLNAKLQRAVSVKTILGGFFGNSLRH